MCQCSHLLRRAAAQQGVQVDPLDDLVVVEAVALLGLALPLLPLLPPLPLLPLQLLHRDSCRKYKLFVSHKYRK